MIKNYKNVNLEQAKQLAIRSAIGWAAGFLFPLPTMAVSLARSTNAVYQKYRNWYKVDGEAEALKKLRKKKTKTTLDEDVAIVNERKKKSGGTQNCVNCSVAIEMRRRGYDVLARNTGMGKTLNEWKNWFELDDSDIKTVAKESDYNFIKNGTLKRKEYVNKQYNKLMNELESQGNGARGTVIIAYDGTNSGHSMFYEVEKGTAKIYDGQVGNSSKTDYVFSMANPNQLQYIRLDDKKVKDEVTMTVRIRKG